jgi:hypothetical protein
MEEDVKVWIEFGWFKVVGSCKHDNIYFGSINGREFFNQH